MFSMPHSQLITDHQTSLYFIVLHKFIYFIIFKFHHYAKNVSGWLLLGCMARSYGNTSSWQQVLTQPSLAELAISSSYWGRDEDLDNEYSLVF